MEVTCSSCKTKINIRDENLPRGKRLRVTCPKCGSKTSVKAPAAEEGEQLSSERIRTDSADAGLDQVLGYNGEGELPDSFEEGAKSALVLGEDEDMGNLLGRQLSGLGYRTTTATDTPDAIGKIRLHQFDVILLSDHFDGADLDNSPILEYLKQLPMSIRRRIFLALIGEEFKTMDLMGAFVMSADLVIAKGDAGKVAGVLRTAVSDKERFYREFKKALDEAGKA